jgi:hypothetical protein
MRKPHQIKSKKKKKTRCQKQKRSYRGEGEDLEEYLSKDRVVERE